MSKTVIIYASKHGTTAKVAYLIAEKLKNNFVLISLERDKNPDIRDYDKVILGASIYAGNPSKRMVNFCNNNREILEQKTIGLFICCMDKNKGQEQLSNAYPEFLQNIAIAKEIMGGEFLFEKMNFIEGFLIGRISKIKSNVSDINMKNIEIFSEKMK